MLWEWLKWLGMTLWQWWQVWMWNNVKWNTTNAGARVSKSWKLAYFRFHNIEWNSLANFTFSGQNLAVRSTSGFLTTEVIIERSMKSWFNEWNLTSVENIRKVGSSTNGWFILNIINALKIHTFLFTISRTIGHFTAMVTERSTAVGCAISSYSVSGWNNTYLMACNYASTNMRDCSVYRAGSTAIGCVSGRDSKYSGLCSIDEPIDPNKLIC